MLGSATLTMVMSRITISWAHRTRARAPTGRPRRCPAAGGRRDMGGADETDTQVPFGCVQWNETETTSANYTEASSVYQVEDASGNGLNAARLVAGPGEVGSDEHGGTPAPDEG